MNWCMISSIHSMSGYVRPCHYWISTGSKYLLELTGVAVVVPSIIHQTRAGFFYSYIPFKFESEIKIVVKYDEIVKHVPGILPWTDGLGVVPLSAGLECQRCGLRCEALQCFQTYQTCPSTSRRSNVGVVCISHSFYRFSWCRRMQTLHRYIKQRVWNMKPATAPWWVVPSKARKSSCHIDSKWGSTLQVSPKN